MSNEARSRDASGKHGHTLISDAKFRRLYALALEQAPDASRGLSAAMAAVAADLRGDDVVLAQARAAAPDFRDRVITALSGATADRLRRNGRLTVIVCAGPGNDPILLDAHQVADEAKLPVLFVEDWRNAGKGSATKKNAQEPAPGTAREIGAMPAIPVDAEDVIAVYRVAHESMTRAREGSGPTRILCVRWPAMNASDKKADAVGHLEHWLEARGLPAQAWRREILAERQAAPSDTADEPAEAAEKIRELRSA
ncbi:MAG TPA: thiamine pyrophosphate-dependent enzyme [Acidobacteriaceae bacterium]|jgi:pyruvate dehydrogenase E1 component alpha subunit|nr:thiamine pyrophosphate-dependent enzyme [Acidobacteriaceae bacterium]